jgi:hypothetical protein
MNSYLGTDDILPMIQNLKELMLALKSPSIDQGS